MQFSVYEEQPFTIRVHGGSEYFELFLKIKNCLVKYDMVDLAFMGSPPAWQAAQALCVLQSTFNVDVLHRKMELKTPEGNRIGVIISISLKKEPSADEATAT